MSMTIPDYDAEALQDILQGHKILLLALRDEDSTQSHVIDSYRMRAAVMCLETFEIAALNASYSVKPTGEPNSAYNDMFIPLSAVGRVLTCAGFECFYIPRRPGQTLPPDEVRIFDPSQENPTYHIANIADLVTFQGEIYDKCCEAEEQ